MLLLLLTQVAYALPGPEVAVPVMLGLVHILGFVVAIGARAWRTWSSPMRVRGLFIGLGIALGVTLGGGAATLYATFVAALWVWTSVRRPAFRVAAVALLAVVSLATWLNPNPFADRQPLERYSPNSEPAAPQPHASIPSLRQGGRQIIHVGEPIIYERCRLPMGSVMRWPDFQKMPPDPDQVLLIFAGEYDKLQTASRMGYQAHSLFDTFPTQRLGCYQPPLLRYLGLIDWRWFSQQVPNSPSDQYFRFGLRPQEAERLVATGAAEAVQAHEVLDAPSPAQWSSSQPVIVIGSTWSQRRGAAQVLHEAGAQVLGVSEPWTGRGSRPALGLAVLGWLLGGAAVLALGLAIEPVRRRLDWAWAAGARRLSPVAGVFGLLLEVAVLAGMGLLVSEQSFSPSLLTLVQPVTTSWGPACLNVLVHVVMWGLLWSRLSRLFPFYRELVGLAVSLAVMGSVVLTINGLVDGVAPMVGVMSYGLAVGGMWAARRALSKRRLRAGQGSLPLGTPFLPSGVGGKAARLNALYREGYPVPPGLLAWQRPGHHWTPPSQKEVGLGPWIVRSSAQDEDTEDQTRAGAYPSIVAQSAEDLREAVARVMGSYEGTPELRCAVIMPYIAADHSGVTLVNGSPFCSQTEYGRGTNAVTSGGEVSSATLGLRSHQWRINTPPGARSLRQFIHRESETVYLEWLATKRAVFLVQRRPAADIAERPQSLSVPLPKDKDGVWLKKMALEGLPDVPSKEARALWREAWSPEHAYGAAMATVGLPRWSLPSPVVIEAWSTLWTVEPVTEELRRAIYWTLKCRAMARRQTVERLVQGILSSQCKDPQRLTEAIQQSILLSFLRGYLPEGATTLPYRSVALSQAVREGTARERFPHRGPFDLDPCGVRYGGAPFARPEPLPQGPVRTREDADARRDYLRDLMAWFISGEKRGALAETSREQRPLQLTLQDAERDLLTVKPHAKAGCWVSGGGPIEGWATYHHGEPGPGRILLISAMTPEIAGAMCQFDGVLSASGGRLSHGAIVAREEGVPALFGVGTLPEEGTRIRLCVDGRYTVMSGA